MQQNIPLAITLVVVGSFCFALSAHFQHSAVGSGVDDKSQKKRMDLRGLAALLTNRRWLLGLALLGASAVLQVLGLVLAPVSVVQPVGLLAFPWSVLLSARAHGHRIPGGMKLAVFVTVAATLAFTIVTAIYSSASTELKVRDVIVASALVYLLAGVMVAFGSSGPKAWRCLFWASGGALFYGLEAALVKAITEYAKHHGSWLTSPVIWGIAAALVVGSVLAGALIQQGYATGPAEVVVGSMTVTSPVVAVLFGVAVLGEGRFLTLNVAFVMFTLGMIAIAGVVALTYAHPENDDPAIPDSDDVDELTLRGL